MKQVFQRINASKDVSNVSDRLGVDADDVISKHQKVQVDRFLLRGRCQKGVLVIVSVSLPKSKVSNITGSNTQKEIFFENFTLFAVVLDEDVFDS